MQMTPGCDLVLMGGSPVNRQRTRLDEVCAGPMVHGVGEGGEVLWVKSLSAVVV